ncbi:MAG: cysteine peptidase family C39 domain-containing protein [Candidatus Omnitrophica bacterium]|nr:cysteine peptidase family C39 domain-containing protein [Candidatus Omnitrophota bacterium]
MKRKINIVLGTIILCSLFLMGLKTAGSVVAHRAIEQGDFSKALELYVIEEDYSGQGIAYCAMKQFDEAIRSFKKGNNASGLGLAYCGKRDFDKAIEHFKLKDDNSGLGLAYCGKRDFNKAKEYFLKGNDRAGLGLAALGENKFEQARNYFNDAKDQNGLGLVLLAEQRFDEAFNHFEKHKNKSGIGMSLLGKKKYNEAVAYFTQANDYSGLSLVYAGKKQYDKAIDFAQSANDLSALGHAYCGKKEYSEAFSNFYKANDISGMSLVYSGKKDFDKAIEYFQKANDNSGLSHAYCGKRDYDAAISYANSANDRSAMGHVYCGKKQYDAAISMFLEANDLSGLSLAYCGKKQFDKAIEYANQANDLSALGYAYCGKKQYDEAINLFRKAQDNEGLAHAYCGKNNAEAALRYAEESNDLSAQGFARLKSHNYEKALEKFKKANDLSGIGFVYSQQKAYEQAIQYAREANDISLMGHIYLGLGDIQKAESCFTQANDLSGLGFVKLEEKKLEEAMRFFLQANDLSGQGYVYSQTGEFEKAEECFQKAEDDAGLGILALQRKQFNKAIEYFTRANDRDGLGDVWWKLRDYRKAANYFKAEGNHLKAVQALRKIDNDSTEAIIYAKKTIEEGQFINPLCLEVGKIYIQQRQYDKAVAEFEKVLNAGSYYDSEALMFIGKARYFQREYNLAEQAFKTLIQMYPQCRYYESAQKAIGTITYLKNIQKRKQGKNKEKGLVLTPSNRCGPDSLSILLTKRGIKTSPEEIAVLAGTDEIGTTMLGLQEAADKKGVKLYALEITLPELLEYSDKVILLIDGNHYVLLKEKREDAVIVVDNFKEKKIPIKLLSKRWQGEILAEKPIAEYKRLSYKQTMSIKGGTEGGTTKGDPGVNPNGGWNMNMSNIGPIIPKGLLKAMGYLFPGAEKAGRILLDNLSSWIGGGDCEQPIDPVCVTSGKLVLPVTDILIPGRGRRNGMGLRVERTYSSASTRNTPFGFGWQGFQLVSLTPLFFGNNSMAVTLPDGHCFTYYRNSDGSYIGPSCDASELIETPNGDYIWKRWTSRYGFQSYYFSVSWEYFPLGSVCTTKLEYIEDQNGNRLTYVRDGDDHIIKISEDSGRYVEFIRNVNTYKIDKINSPMGQYSYYYDDKSNLIEVTGPENYRFQYEYNDPYDIHNLTAVIDANNNRMEYEYDYNDRCVKVTDAQENEAIYNYNTFLEVTTVSDTRGRNTIYEFDEGSITRIIDSNHGITDYTYDDNYRYESRTDINGHISRWKNDNYGNCLEVSDDTGQVLSTMTYHQDFHQVETMIDAKGRVTTYTYDTKGNLKTKDTPGSEGTRAVTSYDYDEYGNLTKLTVPEGIETLYTYDGNGNATKITDGEGNYTEFTYDEANNLISSKYRNDVPTTYEYDGRNRLIKKTYPDISYEQYTYDNNGNLLTFTDVNGHESTYEYNALNHLVKETDAENNTTDYEYDSFGNMTKLIRNVGGSQLTAEMEYDDHYNRVTRIKDPEGEITEYDYAGAPALLHGEQYTQMKKYRADGTPLAVQTKLYDRWYRLKEARDGLGNAAKFTYDETGNLTSVEDPHGKLTAYVYDPDVNLLISQTDPLTKTTGYTYYKNEKIKSETDANNNTISYEYDLAGRLQKKTYPDTTTVQYQYNQYGEVSQMTDTRGIMAYAYNNRGWLVSVDGPEANDTLSYTYDNVGNRLTMTVSGEGATTYDYYDNNLLHTITNPQSRVTSFTYDEAGRCAQMSFNNLTRTEWVYYDNDRIKDITVRNDSQQVISSHYYEYNTFGQLVSITDNDNNVYSYDYDNAGQLLKAEGSALQSTN